MSPQPRRFAYFISSHGFGHASRAAAVMSALHVKAPWVHFEIYTAIPEWFFTESLPPIFSYHPEKTDVGLVQKNSLEEDLPATLRELESFYPFNHKEIERLARQVTVANCEAVVCDIAPMGIEVARRAGIPAVLIENFTWDWIYAGYPEFSGEFSKWIPYLAERFARADVHIQTEPLCVHASSADLLAQPASRKPRNPSTKIRTQLGIAHDQKIVLITLGGIPSQHSFLPQLKNHPEIHFILPGDYPVACVDHNLTLLPHHSQFFHPDLVNTCDAVVGKLGYSTIAEVFHAGVPLLYISRPRFRESPALERYVSAHISAAPIGSGEFKAGNWLPALLKLLETPRIQRDIPNGADQIADLILSPSACLQPKIRPYTF